jgi:hypothetical protein
MPDRITLNVSVDVLPFGTARTEQRVFFEAPSRKEQEQIVLPTNTVACESLPTELPYIIR